MARERRRLVRRRVGLATVAVVAVAATTVAALPHLMGSAPPASRAAPAMSGSRSVEDESFRLVVDSATALRATGQRLARALDEAVIREAPDARWLADDAFGMPNADGRVLEVRVGNLLRHDEPAQRGSPLTVDQVVAIATDIAAKIKA